MRAPALSVLFESASGAVFEREILEHACGVSVGLLLASGFVREVEPASEVVCTECGSPHQVAVQPCEARVMQRYFCVDAGGWIAVNIETLRRFAYDRLQFVSAVSVAVGISRSPEMFIDGACWRLGSTRIAQTDVVMILAREMNDPRRVMELAGVLRRRVDDGLGLILCGAPPLVDLGVFPRGFRAVAFDDLIELDAHGMIGVDLEGAARTLGLIRRGHGEHGAPSDHPALMALIEERFSAGANCDKAADEADYLLSEPNWAHSGRSLPQRESLRKLVARSWDRLNRTR